MEKSIGMGKGGGKSTKSGVVVEMNRWSETKHIQYQQTIPLYTKGKAEGFERKGSTTLLSEKSNVTNSEYWIVNIEVCNTFPTINPVLRYRGPGCICKLTSFKPKI